MDNSTVLKVGGIVVAAAVLFVVIRVLLSWLFRLVALVGTALLAVVLAYVLYRLAARWWGRSSGEI